MKLEPSKRYLYPALKFIDTEHSCEDATQVVHTYLSNITTMYPNLDVKIVLSRAIYDRLFNDLKANVDYQRSHGDNESAEEGWVVIETLESIFERGDL